MSMCNVLSNCLLHSTIQNKIFVFFQFSFTFFLGVKFKLGVQIQINVVFSISIPIPMGFLCIAKSKKFFYVCVVFGRTEVTFKENYYLLQRYINKIRKNLTVKRNRSKEKYANQIKEENTNQNGFFRPAFK